MSQGQARIWRFYPEVRSAHLERSRMLEHSKIFYLRARDDYDAILASDGVAVRASTLGLAAMLIRRPPQILEVPEPLWIQYWPQNTLVCFAARASKWLRRSERPLIVTYCIENASSAQKPRRLRFLPSSVWRLILATWSRCTLSMIDFIAFGTQGARAALVESARVTGRSLASLEARSSVVEALPARCQCPNQPRNAREVLFIGALELRKGIDILMASWDSVAQRSPTSQLTIVGSGPLQSEVSAFAETRPSVRWMGQLERREVHTLLRQAALVVAPSQPYGRWREQVGLPIVEALSHGCGVVTTEQTGLAEWLRANGATVLESPTHPAALSEAVCRSLEGGETPPNYPLPDVDQRESADLWLQDRAADGRQSRDKSVGDAR